MKFHQLQSKPLMYKGCRYRGWIVETQPHEKRLFAENGLRYMIMDGFDAETYALEDKIAYYVSPNDDVDKAIDNYLDEVNTRELEIFS